MSFDISMGPILQNQSRHQITYAAGSRRQYSFFYRHNCSQDPLNILDQLIPEMGAIYVMDPGYLDFERLSTSHQSSPFFVVRSQLNTRLRGLYPMPVDKSTGLRCDQIILPPTCYAKKDSPENLPYPKFYDTQKNNGSDF